MRLKEYAAKNGGSLNELASLPPSLIEVDPDFNPRDIASQRMVDHIREIANSILANGYDQTEVIKIRWTGDRAFVRDGHCRLAAIRLAQSEGAVVGRVPVQPMPRASNELDDAYQVLTTQTKLPLAPSEWTTQIRKLLAQGQTEKLIIARLGKPRDFIARLLDLAEAPADVRQTVDQGRISPTAAVNLIRQNGHAGGREIIAKAVEHARAEGRERARPRDVAAVTKPRETPVSLCSLAMAVVRADDDGDMVAVRDAIAALRTHLGPLAVAA